MNEGQGAANEETHPELLATPPPKHIVQDEMVQQETQRKLRKLGGPVLNVSSVSGVSNESSVSSESQGTDWLCGYVAIWLG